MSLQVLIFSNPSSLLPSAAVTCLFSLVCALVLAFLDKRAERILDKEEGRTGRSGTIRPPSYLLWEFFPPLSASPVDKRLPLYKVTVGNIGTVSLLIYRKPAEVFQLRVDWSCFLYLALFVHLSQKPIHFLLPGFNSTTRSSH